MKFLKIILFSLSLMIIVPSCTTTKSHCGTKRQKRAKHKAMKAGRAPGGNM